MSVADMRSLKNGDECFVINPECPNPAKPLIMKIGKDDQGFWLKSDDYKFLRILPGFDNQIQNSINGRARLSSLAELWLVLRNLEYEVKK